MPNTKKTAKLLTISNPEIRSVFVSFMMLPPVIELPSKMYITDGKLSQSIFATLIGLRPRNHMLNMDCEGMKKTVEIYIPTVLQIDYIHTVTVKPFLQQYMFV